MQQKTVQISRLVIGAPKGRSGKSMVTMGLLAALMIRGLKVQLYKNGPDITEFGWLASATGRPCHNFDSFLMSREVIRQSFIRHAVSADLGIVEGVDGLFDSVDLAGRGSTAEVAKAIQAPVILVVDTARITRSVAAVVMGFMRFDPDIRLAGVILNRVAARPRHENMMRSAIEQYCGLPVLGAIPKGVLFNIPDQHLGLIPTDERKDLDQALEEIGQTALKYLDLDGLLQVSANVPPLEITGGEGVVFP